MRHKIKSLIKRAIDWPPVPAMTIDNQYALLDAILHKRNLPGPVVEIGVATGGTTVNACRFLSRIGCQKTYYCVDTFAGFVNEQLATDHRLGLDQRHDRLFADNSMKDFASALRRWGVEQNVELVKADICKIDPNDLPNDISVCLLDVDLRDPIYEGLQRLESRMADGGVVLIDDCKAGTSWVGADVGYRDYMAAAGRSPEYYMGFGVVQFGSADRLPWSVSSTANAIQNNYYAA